MIPLARIDKDARSVIEPETRRSCASAREVAYFHDVEQAKSQLTS